MANKLKVFSSKRYEYVRVRLLIIQPLLRPRFHWGPVQRYSCQQGRENQFLCTIRIRMNGPVQMYMRQRKRKTNLHVLKEKNEEQKQDGKVVKIVIPPAKCLGRSSVGSMYPWIVQYRRGKLYTMVTRTAIIQSPTTSPGTIPNWFFTSDSWSCPLCLLVLRYFTSMHRWRRARDPLCSCEAFKLG